MSYPQPNSNGPALGGTDFFRLQTPLVSPGDIYESAQGAHGFAVGPDSDIARIDVTYWDAQQSTTFANSMQISPSRNFVGFVPSHNEPAALYQPSRRQGRTLIAPADIYNPNYVPSFLTPDQDSVAFITPTLDVIQYFANIPSVAPQRSDRHYPFQGWPPTEAVGVFSSYVLIPFWGRSYASIAATAQYGVNQQPSLTVRGINFAYAPVQTQEVVLLGATLIPNLGAITEIVKSSSDGMFDMLMIGVLSGSAGTDYSQVHIDVVTSDLVR